ncbi:MFS transporter [Streptomyces sp. TRM72054]|uniref:MFS transporter n=1 Tax=Streptomyces sp. TRM72054 TaxID=2870562 RepID=UPI001C8C5900|nr:MFS transporter [Streptomyces sp. TRM72054]MBX9395055.1 MFS transporter [Streptomyces sp. TRM72054]
MRSYRHLFRTPEFTPLFLSSSAHIAGQTIGGLALGTLVYEATRSPLLSAVSMFGPSLAQVLGATLFLSWADGLPPRNALTAVSAGFAVGTALLALPGLPIGAVLVVVLAQGLIASLGGGVRWGLLTEILPKDGYLLGRSVFNMMSGVMQISGYATGGALLVAIGSARVTLLLSALLFLAAAVLARLGLGPRPARTSARPSVAATWRTNALLWSSAPRRRLYLALWVPNGLIVGCESLFVPYAPGAAGLLFACAALGMFVGDVTIGRLVSRAVRARLGVPLLLLLAAPYLLFFTRPAIPLAAVAVAVASVGFGSSLVQQERLLALVPEELSGHALGLHSAGMLTTQGVSAALAGAVAQVASPAVAMTAMAGVSVAVTGCLGWGMRRGGRGRAERGAIVPG